MNAQEIVAANVAARGYRDGWTTEQFVARQLAKATEELGEAIDYVVADSPYPEYWPEYWIEAMDDATHSARKAFDEPSAWRNVWAKDLDAICSELADIAVVLFAAAQALDFDLIQAAIDKSGADIPRGVR